MSVSSTSDTILQIQQILLLYYWFGRISGKTPCKKQPARKRKVIEDSSSESSDDDKRNGVMIRNPLGTHLHQNSANFS